MIIRQLDFFCRFKGMVDPISKKDFLNLLSEIEWPNRHSNGDAPMSEAAVPVSQRPLPDVDGAGERWMCRGSAVLGNEIC
jgi:hypothetical protein